MATFLLHLSPHTRSAHVLPFGLLRYSGRVVGLRLRVGRHFAGLYSRKRANMARKTFVDGVALPASDINTYLMNQVNVVCTSGTRPSSPLEGMSIYETDTDKFLIYTTVTTGWQKPWSNPWGIVAFKVATAGQTGIGTTYTSLTTLTDTTTYVANRRIKIQGYARLTQQTGTGTPELAICEGGTQLQRESTLVAGPAWTTQSPMWVLTPTAGAHTYNLQLRTSAFTVDVSYAADQPALMIIEDIGPASAPA